MLQKSILKVKKPTKTNKHTNEQIPIVAIFCQDFFHFHRIIFLEIQTSCPSWTPPMCFQMFHSAGKERFWINLVMFACLFFASSRYITQEGHKLEVGAPRPPATVTNAVSWRSEGIKYRKNEVFMDVIESVNLLVRTTYHILQKQYERSSAPP